MKPTLGRPQETRIINACVHPLLIIDVSSPYGSGNLFYFSRLLHPKVRLWVAVRPEALQIRDGFSDVFIYDPSLLLRQKLEQEEGFTIKTIGTPGRLWRVIKEP
jgi:hypothetical protein